MNLFAGIKELFNKNIDCGEDMNNHIVFFLNKKKYIYLNKNIIVRDGSVCVVVYKHKVRDVILPGKYKINENSFPGTYTKAKVDKKSKKGRKVKKIRVDLYYVNTNEIKGFDFNSNEDFVIRSKEMGRVKGFAQGICTLRVLDAGLLMKALLNNGKQIKTKIAPKEIGLMIGNRVNKRIQKDKITVDMIFNNHEKINMMLNTELEDAYDNVGIFVKNIRLKAMNFNKRSQKKINSFLVANKKLVKSSNILKTNWEVQNRQYSTVSMTHGNAMQNTTNKPNMNTFKICNRCGFRNNSNAVNCRNCHSRFNNLD